MGAVGLGAGAVLAVLGSLLPVFEQVLSFTPEKETYSMTLWGVESSFDFGEVDGNQIHYGVPVVVAAGLLVVAAALVLAGPRLPARFAGPTSLVAIAAAALLTGSVWTVGQIVLLALTSSASTGPVTTVVGAGTPALVLACVLAFGGGLLAQRWPERAVAVEPEPRGAVVYRLPDDDTPPFGIPVAEDTRGGGA